MNILSECDRCGQSRCHGRHRIRADSKPRHASTAANIGVDMPTRNNVRGSDYNDKLLGSSSNEPYRRCQRRLHLTDGLGGADRASYYSFTDDTVHNGITVNLAAGTVSGTAPGDLANVGTDIVAVHRVDTRQQL